MFRVSTKLKTLKNEIRTFSRENYSDLEKRVQEAHVIVLDCQTKLLLDPTPSLAEEEAEAQRKWQVLATAEESFLHQRSRVTWLKVGDSSTLFYHRMMSLRKSANHIHFLLDDQDVKWENQEDINNICVEYFSNLLGGEVLPKMFVQSDIDLLLPFRCSSTQASALERPFSAVEIKEAFFSLPHNKTCGPDGYSAEFFTGCWNIVGAEVCEAVAEFFSSGQLLKQWNATTLVLIPKIPTT